MTTSLPTGWTDTQTSAYDLMNAQLSQWGLSSLAGEVQKLVSGGISDSNELQLSLEATDAWKTRFAGNEILKKNGQNVLSVADYLSTENSYAQVMKNYGLPSGFYDDKSDFANWIGNQVSASEVNQRAQMYSDLASRQDSNVTDQLTSMGLSKGDLLAWMMDPKKAQPLIQQKYQTALVGAAARDAGVVSADPSKLVEQGVTEAQARQGFGTIAADLPTLSRLGDIYGEHLGESDLEDATFEGDATAQAKQKRLASQERAAFSGSSGTSTSASLRSTSGSY